MPITNVVNELRVELGDRLTALVVGVKDVSLIS